MKFRLALLAIAFVAAALSAARITAQEEEPPGEEQRLSPDEEKAVEKFIFLKAGEARQAVENRNFDYAVRLIDSILLLAPETPLKNELKELRIKAAQEKLQRDVARAYLYCAKKVYKAGEKIEVKLRIRNLTSEKITLPLTDEQSRNFGVLVKEIHDYKLLGSTRMRRSQLVMKQDSPIVLEENQLWEKTFEIDTSRVGGAQPVFRRYVLQAVMRPVEIVTGSERFSRYLATGELEIRVMPPEHAPLAGNALEHLVEATSFIAGKPVPGEMALDETGMAQTAVFYSVFFLTGPQAQEAMAHLFEALEASAGDTSRVLMGCLSFLTGEKFGTSREDWLNWWKKRKELPGDTPGKQ